MSLGFRLRLFIGSALLVFLPFLIADRFLAVESQIPFLVLGVLSAASVALVIALISSRWLARELGLITQAARRMAEGDLAARTRLRGAGEIAALGSALDRLAESLSGAIEDLRTQRDLVGGILDGMQEGVLLVDRNGYIKLVNPALRDTLLLSQDVVGRPVLSVIRHSALMELIDGVRAKRRPMSVEIDLGGLKPRRVLVQVALLANAEGSLLAVFVDVTDLRRLEGMRRDFVANVSHELRTPVTAVQSAAETLRTGAMNEAGAADKFLGIIERNAERLRNLIDDLLELSRIESKAFKLRPERVDLGRSVQSIFAQAKERAARQQVELVSAVEPAAQHLTSDPRALEQVLGNLVENAVKYCPGARVRVSVKPRATSGVTLVVSDSGPGIESRHLPRIFERFYRVDPGRSREVGGTGLGLSIVKHLVEALGGTVSVTSVVGEGTTFTVELPQIDDSTPRLPSDEPSAEASPLP